MALFFDSAWFDARLSALGMKRDDVASVLGLTKEQVGELWKDQRELKADDVRLLASLIGAPVAEVADRAGVSTPVPKDMTDGVEARLARIEAQLAAIHALLLEMKERR
jgi:transcriptional regulator with XRE-family HTH domain